MMKRYMSAGAALGILALALGPGLAAESTQPGQVDFGTFSRSASGGEFVEVNLKSGILALAARVVPKNEPEIARLLSELQEVRVNVVGLDDDNRDQIRQQADKIKAALTTQGWERIVTAQKKAEDVGIYVKMGDKDAIAGLTVIVLDGKKEAVFVNIVGNIRADQLALLGERLNLDPLKKLGRETPKESAPAKD